MFSSRAVARRATRGASLLLRRERRLHHSPNDVDGRRVMGAPKVDADGKRLSRGLLAARVCRWWRQFAQPIGTVEHELKFHQAAVDHADFVRVFDAKRRSRLLRHALEVRMKGEVLVAELKPDRLVEYRIGFENGGDPIEHKLGSRRRGGN